MRTFWQDLLYGVRLLLKQRSFTVIAVITLALGIGANTAIFSVVNAMLLRPLPYPAAERLMTLSTNGLTGPDGNTGYATFVDWRERSKSFEQLSVVRSWGGTLTGQGEPEMIMGLRVSANYFKLLGVAPALGRDFRADEDRPDTRFVMMLSYALWQRRFGADPNIVGKQVQLSGTTFTVVGVMPAGFEDYLSANWYKSAEAWAPIGYDVSQSWACRDCQHLKAVARLKADVSLAQAQTEMNAISAALQREHPKIYVTPTATVMPLQAAFVKELRPALYLLLVAVGFLLLIACVNVANLLLARATQRERELAIRTALGAGRWRIARQLLTESLLLSLAGAAGGLLLAWWGTEALVALSPASFPKTTAINADARVLSFTLLLSLLTGLLFGSAPAWQATKLDLQTALKESGKALLGSGRKRLRGLLVVAEVALALILLLGAGLLFRSFAHVLRVSPGFETDHLVTMTVPAASARYANEAAVSAFYQQLLSRIEALPGVTGAGIVSNLPFGGNMDKSGFHVEEKPLPNPAEAPSAERYSISPTYLQTMGIPLLRGRAFNERDTRATPFVALINQVAAKRIWPNEDPLGKRIRMGGPDDPLRTIVGVVGDVNHYGLDNAPDMQVYLPHAQWSDAYVQLVMRTTNEPSAIVNAARREVHALDKELPIYRVATMRELVSASVAQRRFTLTLVAVFAALALLLAAIGIYGVVSYTVTQRTQEIGIRLALGAQTRDVLRLVIGQGMKLALLGVAAGVVGAAGLTQWMQGMLFGIAATDPLTFGLTAAALAGVALLACWLPARRAARVDPLVALRYE
jgi:putative ABC transport system permease protein